jgi:ribose transport system substrate-binding protein
MKLRAVLPVLLTATILLGGCGKREGSASSGKTTIAVIPKGTTHEFWKSIHAGAVKAARELNVEIIWKGPLREDDRDQQISVMEDFISRKVNAIVLAPLDDIALRGPVANAKAAGIPTVIIDSDLKSEDYISFAVTDNYLGGKIGAQELIRLLNGKGRVIMLRVLEGSASTTNRERGFLETIATAPGITVVSSNQYGGPTVETAYRASENVLAPLNDASGNLTINGVFTPNESTTFGMLRALQDGGHAGKVTFVGFDSSPKLVEAVRNRQLNALVVQNPMAMGYIGVKTAVAHLRGEKVERLIDTGVVLVTTDNIDKPEIKELIQPDLARWLE